MRSTASRSWSWALFEKIEEQSVFLAMKRDKGLCVDCGGDATDVVVKPRAEWDERPMSMYKSVCDDCRARFYEQLRAGGRGRSPGT